jgi:diacylglycerol kinase
MLERLVKSFSYAFHGLTLVFKQEQNFRLQIFGGFIVLCGALFFPLRGWELVVIIGLVVAVLVMEVLNTVVEHFIDLLKPRMHHYVSVIKDIMAGAVLLTAIGAVTIGTIIFYPHLVNLVK